jgi:probable phosphoglycerate mutase
VTRELGDLYLIRHGETEWSRTGRHTGRTDVPLTDHGREEAEAVGRALHGRRFALVATSPLSRAVETCRLAGLGHAAQTWPELAEWDYGAYEGLTTAEIRTTRPGWSLFTDGVPDGETIAAVAGRADTAIARLHDAAGDVALFSHGHLLRVLAARWIGLDPAAGRLLTLGAGSVSILGHERETRVIRLWNLRPGAAQAV